MRRFGSSLVLVGLVLLAGCGQVEPLRNARLLQAAELNQRAGEAFRLAEYRLAAKLYERALRIDIALEQVEGIAIDTLNLARVMQVSGNPVRAGQLLDGLLNDTALQYPPVYLARAALQQSMLRLEQDDAAQAAVWVDKAAAFCGNGCADYGVVANVRAMIALQRADAAPALEWSTRAVNANRGVPLEHANALRVQASALLLQAQPEQALRRANEALQIDKALGLPQKIRQDLLLLAQAHAQLGQAGQAAQMRERAARIAATALK